MADGKGRLGWRLISRPPVLTREIASGNFPACGCQKIGLETGFILLSAIPAEAGRSSPHAVIISSPSPVSRTSCHRQRAAT
jgi:hypothetical protein